MLEKIKKHKIDIIVISAILLIVAIALTITLTARRQGELVRVTVDGATVGEYSLRQSGEYVLNGGTNILVIENGVAYLSYADCPDHTCINTGKIKYVGQSIICLPNKLTVTVVGDRSGGVDLVS